MSEDKETKVEVITPDQVNIAKTQMGKDVNVRQFLGDHQTNKTKEKIDAEIEKEHATYATRALEQVNELKSSVNLIKSGDSNFDNGINKIKSIALEMKGSSEMFSYPLGSKIAKSLYELSKNCKKYDKTMDTLLDAYINTLQIIFSQNIRDADSPIARELLNEFMKISNSKNQ
ncbi:hypothetical protein N9W34_04010 [Rickettsiales bacterium]|nr:hypothetical protein [Rickettsiales bacterium]